MDEEEIVDPKTQVYRWLESAPQKTLTQEAATCEAAVENVQQIFADRLRPLVELELKKQHAKTAEDVKDAAKRLNAVIQPLGLTAICPATGLPSTLVGMKLKSGNGTFQFYTKRSDGSRYSSHRAQDLKTLTLAPKGTWQQRARVTDERDRDDLRER